MQQLIATIENLLIEHDCVVVPGLGGFIHNHQEAYYDEKRALFFPSGKQLSFNARLFYNDGLLCQAYQMQFNLSFEAANLRIRQAVASLKENLAENHYVSLGRLGHLTQTSLQAALVFEPAMRNDLCARSFGLKPCAFPSSVSQKAQHEQTPWLSYVATIAACFLLLFTFVQDKDALSRGFNTSVQPIQLQEAAVMPLCTVTSNTLGADMEAEHLLALNHHLPAETPAEIAAETSVENAVESAAETVAESSLETSTKTIAENPAETITEKPAETIVPVAVESAAKTPVESAAKTPVESPVDVVETPAESASLLNYPALEKQYLIVIASFPTAEQAEAYIQSRHLQEQYPSVGVAVGAERCRVYAQAYASKSEALSHLDAFRQSNPKYAKAWVLVH